MNDSILDLIVAPWKIYAIYAATRLKIFSVLSDKKMNCEEVSLKCYANSRLLKPLLDVCVNIGLLGYKDAEYMNSQFSQKYLIEGEPNYVGDLIELQHDESDQWNNLCKIILGKEEIRSESDKHRTFIKAMNNLGMSGEAEALKNAVELSACKEMVDVGGGSGLYSVTLCRKYPALRSTIIDLSKTVELTRKMISDCPEKARIILREADIVKESYGENLDAVLISDVIYDELNARRILLNSWNCLRNGGLLVIRGYYSDAHHSSSIFSALFVLNVLVFDPDRKILTLTGLKKLVSETGFIIDNVAPLTEKSTVLLARKEEK